MSVDTGTKPHAAALTAASALHHELNNCSKYDDALLPATASQLCTVLW